MFSLPFFARPRRCGAADDPKARASVGRDNLDFPCKQCGRCALRLQFGAPCRRRRRRRRPADTVSDVLRPLDHAHSPAVVGNYGFCMEHRDGPRSNLPPPPKALQVVPPRVRTAPSALALLLPCFCPAFALLLPCLGPAFALLCTWPFLPQERALLLGFPPCPPSPPCSFCDLPRGPPQVPRPPKPLKTRVCAVLPPSHRGTKEMDQPLSDPPASSFLQVPREARVKGLLRCDWEERMIMEQANPWHTVETAKDGYTGQKVLEKVRQST